jgi:hypothetical protein
MSATITLTSARQAFAETGEAMVPIMINDGMDPEEASLSAEFWLERCVTRIARKRHRSRKFAEEAMDAAVAFLDDRTVHSPTWQADIGWHAMLEYTYEYRAFCMVRYHKFINHRPDDIPGHVRGGCSSGPKCGGNPKCAKCDD